MDTIRKDIDIKKIETHKNKRSACCRPLILMRLTDKCLSDCLY